MISRIFRYNGPQFVKIVTTGSQVPVEAREIASGDLEADPVAGRKVIAGGVQINFQRVHFSGFHPDLLIEALAVTCGENAVW